MYTKNIMTEPICNPLSIDPIMGEEISFDNPDSIAFVYEDPVQPGVYGEDFKPFGNAPICSTRESIEAEILTQSRTRPADAILIDSARKLLFKRERHSNLNFDDNGKLNGAVGVKSPFTIFKITLGTGLTIGITPASVYKLLTVRNTKVFYVQPVFFDTEVINGVRKIPRIRNMSTNNDAYLTIGAVHGQDVSALPVYSISNIKNEKRYPITEMMIGADTLMGKLKANVGPELGAKIPNTDYMYHDNSKDFTQEPVMERFWDTRGKGHDFKFWESQPYHSQLESGKKKKYIVQRYLEDPRNSNGLYIMSNLRMGYATQDEPIKKDCETINALSEIIRKPPTNFIGVNADREARKLKLTPSQSVYCRRKLDVCPRIVQAYDRGDRVVEGLDREDSELIRQVETCRDIISSYDPFAPQQPAREGARAGPRVLAPAEVGVYTQGQCEIIMAEIRDGASRIRNLETGQLVKVKLANGRENPIVTRMRERCAVYEQDRPAAAPQAAAPQAAAAEESDFARQCREYLANYERSATVVNPLTGRRIKTRNANGRLTVLALRIKDACNIAAAEASDYAPIPTLPRPDLFAQAGVSARACQKLMTEILNRRSKSLTDPVTGRKLKFKLSDGEINPDAYAAALRCGVEASNMFIDRFNNDDAPQPAPAPIPTFPIPQASACEKLISELRNRRSNTLTNPVTGRKLKFKLSNGEINQSAYAAAVGCGVEASTLFISRFAGMR